MRDFVVEAPNHMVISVRTSARESFGQLKHHYYQALCYFEEGAANINKMLLPLLGRSQVTGEIAKQTNDDDVQ